MHRPVCPTGPKKKSLHYIYIKNSCSQKCFPKKSQIILQIGSQMAWNQCKKATANTHLLKYTFNKASIQWYLSLHGNKKGQAIPLIKDIDSRTFGWRCQTLADYPAKHQVSEPRHTSDIYSSYLSKRRSCKYTLACLPTRDALARVEQASAPPATAPCFRVKVIASPIDPDGMILGVLLQSMDGEEADLWDHKDCTTRSQVIEEIRAAGLEGGFCFEVAP